MSQIHNFNAGPAILPQEAINNGISGLQDFKGSGMSVAEVSHRSTEWTNLMNEVTQLVRDLLNVPQTHSILFLQGGATTQFATVPMNLMPTNGKAAYMKTGNWAKKAIKEAEKFGNVHVACSSEDTNFSYIPKDMDVPDDAAYIHATSNNTIFGTQMNEFPDHEDTPLICDMSSDIFSRPINVSKFGMIYAGAQKNMGPAGVTLVIVKDEILNNVNRQIPEIFNYQTHIDKSSLYNTPPVLPIYFAYQTLKWVENKGGVEEMKNRNEEKAQILYDEIDRNSLFEGTVAEEDRSNMNATFVTSNPDHEAEFLQEAQNNNFVGIKGHRSVGGFRASMYNALPKESVEALVDLMKDFEQRKA